VVDFRGNLMNKFSLKYLAKYICEFDIESICINGSFERPMPIRALQNNKLVSLNLRDTGLYSEDLFIISQVLKDNVSLKEIDLSKNMIGLTYIDDERYSQLKQSNQRFDKDIYDSLGLEHFTIALKSSSRVRVLDISQNDIGSENFTILLPIFESNGHIEDLNLADTNIDGPCTDMLCKILKKKNKALK